MWSVINNIFNGHYSPEIAFQQIDKLSSPKNLADSLPVRDMDKLLAITGGDQRLADEMFQQLCLELPQQLLLIKNYIDQSDWFNLTEIAHKIHGSTSSCGVPALDNAINKFRTAM